MTSAVFQELLETLVRKQEELKALKKTIREIEKDVPVELEDKLLMRKEMSKEIKELQNEHINNLLENNVEYGEMREQTQLLLEEIADSKLALFTEATNMQREHGDLDRTVVIEGVPQRVQTQSEVSLYVNGKALK